MPGKTWLAVLALQVGAALTAFFGVSAVAFCFFSTPVPDPRVILTGLTVLGGGAALSVLFLVLAGGLGRRRFWAWALGVPVFVLFLPTPFFPLGVLGLWGLLDRQTKLDFGFKPPAPAPPPTPPANPAAGGGVPSVQKNA